MFEQQVQSRALIPEQTEKPMLLRQSADGDLTACLLDLSLDCFCWRLLTVELRVARRCEEHRCSELINLRGPRRWARQTV